MEDGTCHLCSKHPCRKPSWSHAPAWHSDGLKQVWDTVPFLWVPDWGRNWTHKNASKMGDKQNGASHEFNVLGTSGMVIGPSFFYTLVRKRFLLQCFLIRSKRSNCEARVPCICKGLAILHQTIASFHVHRQRSTTTTPPLLDGPKILLGSITPRIPHSQRMLKSFTR